MPPIHSAATLRHSPAQREQQAEGAARRRKRETAPSEQFGTPRRRRPPPPSSSPSSRRASRHCEPPARHQVTAALPSFDPTTAGKPQLPLAFATRALVPWPPSPARPKHHLALFSHAHRTLARSHAAHTRVGSKARPLLSHRESRSGSAYARSPRTCPGRRHERTRGESQKHRSSRTTRSPRTHAAYALNATRRTRPNRPARGREHDGHTRSWDALRFGRCAPLESPKLPLELSPCSRTHRAHAVIKEEARERRGRGTAARPPWPAPTTTRSTPSRCSREGEGS